MIPYPNQLRMFANEWRNIAGAASAELERMRDNDVSSHVLVQACVAATNALTVAAILEDQADHIEALVADGKVPPCVR